MYIVPKNNPKGAKQLQLEVSVRRRFFCVNIFIESLWSWLHVVEAVLLHLSCHL